MYEIHEVGHMMIICNEIGRQQGRDDVFYLVLRNTAQMNENDSGPAIGKNIQPSFGLGNEEREKSIGDVYIVGGAPFCVVFEAGICVSDTNCIGAGSE